MSNNLLQVVAGNKNSLLKIGDVDLECYVLEDGTRVFSGNGLQKALGFSTNSGGSALTKMLDTGGIANIITDEIKSKFANRVEFKRPGAGGAVEKTYGYDATLLIDICDLLLEGKNRDILTEKQSQLAIQAEIIIRSVAKVGIVALIDEATGYQSIRSKEALRALLDKYLLKEFSTWAKRFPDEFYINIFRLNNWDIENPNKLAKPGVVGTWTNNIIYERLAPGVLDELKRINPKNDKGYRKAKHHQYLSPEVGHPSLAQHMTSVLTLMKISSTWNEFLKFLDKAHPKKGSQLELNFED